MSDKNISDLKAKAASKPAAKKVPAKSTKSGTNKADNKPRVAEKKPVTEEVSSINDVPVVEDIIVEKAPAVEEAAKVVEEPTVEVKLEVVNPDPVAEEVTPRPPSWDVETWIALSNLKLGISAYAMAAALHSQTPGTMLTEDEVKGLLTSVLGTKIN